MSQFASFFLSLFMLVVDVLLGFAYGYGIIGYFFIIVIIKFKFLLQFLGLLSISFENKKLKFFNSQSFKSFIWLLSGIYLNFYPLSSLSYS